MGSDLLKCGGGFACEKSRVIFHSLRIKSSSQFMETLRDCRLTSFFHSLARSEGSHSSWQILSLSSCRATQPWLVATARSAMLSFFSRTAL